MKKEDKYRIFEGACTINRTTCIGMKRCRREREIKREKERKKEENLTNGKRKKRLNYARCTRPPKRGTASSLSHACIRLQV